MFKKFHKKKRSRYTAHNAWLGVWHAKILKRLWIVSMVSMACQTAFKTTIQSSGIQWSWRHGWRHWRRERQPLKREQAPQASPGRRARSKRERDQNYPRQNDAKLSRNAFWRHFFQPEVNKKNIKSDVTIYVKESMCGVIFSLLKRTACASLTPRRPPELWTAALAELLVGALAEAICPVLKRQYYWPSSMKRSEASWDALRTCE